MMKHSAVTQCFFFFTTTRSSGTCLLFSNTLIEGMIQSLFILARLLPWFLQGNRAQGCSSASLWWCSAELHTWRKHIHTHSDPMDLCKLQDVFLMEGNTALHAFAAAWCPPMALTFPESWWSYCVLIVVQRIAGWCGTVQGRRSSFKFHSPICIFVYFLWWGVQIHLSKHKQTCSFHKASIITFLFWLCSHRYARPRTAHVRKRTQQLPSMD